MRTFKLIMKGHADITYTETTYTHALKTAKGIIGIWGKKESDCILVEVMGDGK